MLQLSSVVLYYNDQPDFARLRERGWEQLAFEGSPLPNSMTKTFEGLMVQVVQREFGPTHRDAPSRTYTEVYIHGAGGQSRILLKGDGAPIKLNYTLIGILMEVVEDLEAARRPEGEA